MDYFHPPAMECPRFPCGVREFDLRAAWWMAEFSRLAYEPKRRVALELQQAGFHKVAFFDNDGTQAYLAEFHGDQRFAVLAFRGTESDFTDILTDISFFPRNIPDQQFKAHGGFVEALRKVWGTSASEIRSEALSIQVEWHGPDGISEALDQLIDNEDGEDVFLCYTGHSLGAALATLAAGRIRPDVLYTFGSPRVAGNELARHLNAAGRAPIYRVVNSSDVIPQVPLRGRFEHVGQFIYLRRDGTFTRRESLNERVAEFLIDSFLLFVGLPLILLVKLLLFQTLGRLFQMIIPDPLLRLTTRPDRPHPIADWWLHRIKPRLLFMFTNHGIASYSGRLCQQLRRRHRQHQDRPTSQPHFTTGTPQTTQERG